MVNPTTSPLIFSKLLYNIYLPLPIFLPPTNKNCLVIFLNPSPPELPFLRSLPYISLRKHRGEVHNAILIPKLKRRFQYSSAVPRSIAGCSYKEYRGSAHRARGLINRDSNKIRYQTLPLPCLAALRDATKQ